MALRRDDPLIQRGLEYVNRGAPITRATTDAEDAASQVPDAARPTQQQVEAERRRRALSRTSETEKALNKGMAGVSSGMIATRGLARNLIVGDGSGDADLERAVAIQEQAAAEGPRIQQVEQIGGVGDALAYGRNMIVEQVPNMAMMLATGGGAGLLRTGGAALARRSALRAGAERAAARGAGDVVENAALKRATDTIARRMPAAKAPTETAQRVGAAVGGVTLQGGQVAEAALDETEGGTSRERSGKAALGALATGAVEALPVMALMRRYGLAPAEEAMKSVATGGLARRIATQAAKQGATESATEVAQTVGELATHKWINSNVDMLGDEAMSAYINAAVGGAVGGAAFGAPAGLRSAKGDDPNVRDQLRAGWDSLQAKIKPRVDGAVDATKSRVQGFTQDVKDGFAAGQEAAGGMPEGPSMGERFTAFREKLMGEQRFNSVMAGIDGKPYDFSVIDGEAVISGAPLNTFVDNTRALQYKTNLGLDRQQAMWASPIESEATVSQLRETGAFEAAQKAFTGWDTGKFSDQEQAVLWSYIEALPEPQAVQFQRTLMTYEAMEAKGVLERNEDGSLGDAYVYRPESAGRFATATDAEPQEQAAEREAAGIFESTPETRLNVFRAGRGSKVKGNPPGSVIMEREDGSGDRRRVNLYGAISELRKDRTFVQTINNMDPEQRTEAQIVSAISMLAEQGYMVDPESIRSGIKLAENWVITPAQAMRIRAGLGDQRAIDVMAQRGARQPLEPRGRAIDDARGQADRNEFEEEALSGDPDAAAGVRAAPRNVPILPGQGSPGVLGNTSASDTGAVDVAALRRERQQLRERERAPSGRSVAERSTRNRHKGGTRQSERARRNTDVVSAGANARQQAIQDDAERGGSNERTREASQRRNDEQRDLGRAVGEAVSGTFTNSTAASALRDYMRKAKDELVGAWKEGMAEAKAKATMRRAADAGDFALAIAKLMQTKAGVERMVLELPNVRSRMAMIELSNVLEMHRGSEFFDRAAAALMKRNDQLLGEIGSAASRQSARGDGPGRRVPRSVYVTQLEDFTEAYAGDALVHPGPVPIIDVLNKLMPKMLKEQRSVLQQLISNGALKGVTFSMDVHSRPVGTGGVYNFMGDTVNLSMPDPETVGAYTTDVYSVLVHEAIHAATLKAEAKNSAARKDLNRLLNHVRDSLKARGEDIGAWYGLSETQEFLAEAFSNPDFQDLLARVPAIKTATFQNAWEEFKSWVAELLGFTPNHITAFEEALTIGRALAREQGIARLENRVAMWNGTSFNSFNSAAAAAPADFLQMLSPEDRARLLGAFEVGAVREQIRAVLAPNQRHLVDTADVGPELLLNLGVAMAIDGKLKLDGADRSVARKLWDTISKFLKIPSANVYAQQIVADIKAGKVNRQYRADQRVLVKNPNDALGKAALGITRWTNSKVVPVADALLKNMNTRIRETGVPAMRELATLVAQRTGEFRADRSSSYRQRWEQERGKRLNNLSRILRGLDEDTSVELAAALQQRARPTDAGKARLYDAVRSYLDEMYDYMSRRGVKGLRRKGEYFPVVMDREAVAENRDEFFALHREFEGAIRTRFMRWTQDAIDALGDTSKDRVRQMERDRLEAVLEKLETRDIDELIGELYDMAQYGSREHYIAGVDHTNPKHAPAFAHVKHMTSDFIYDEGTEAQRARFEKFQSKNLTAIMANYTNRAVRRAEWENMDMTGRITGLIAKAAEQGADKKQLQMMRDYVNMEMGTYNDSWNPLVHRFLKGMDRMFDTKMAETDFQKAKAVMGALQTYNNLRLLPLAVLSSLIDPIATMVRSGGFNDAAVNLRDGFRAMRNKDGGDELRAMAEQLGTIEREGLTDIMASMYGNVYDPGGTSAKINNALFKYNGMEGVLRFTRLTALAAGHRFLIRHKTNPTQHSERYLRELGLSPQQIKVSANGKYVELTGATEAALRRFVDESTVRPSPGQKPGWHNDPNFALAAQYKAYLYAFYETVLLRAANELGKGNPAVLAPMMLYLPITLMAEMSRDVLQGDDDEKEIEDYLVKSVERSGVLGPRHGMVTEAGKNVEYGNGLLGNFAGPSGQQLGDAYDVAAGDASFGGFFEEALPGQALYKNWGEE